MLKIKLLEFEEIKSKINVTFESWVYKVDIIILEVSDANILINSVGIVTRKIFCECYNKIHSQLVSITSAAKNLVLHELFINVHLNLELLDFLKINQINCYMLK
ncbi:Hypothetical protein SRAE_X000146950 [Strongyloides ratti]|uniref:Uncharacterized protein n=1 Tax=Strongyloides ratti TaxID=34506 RepID=A0A090KQU2_STRRB|nr:Hypothetical protein SRAE_X000146950 [Strongyloides ratti]CEF59724.1 Hypothetical protein SRAE_X000146950 [Strongyloides ratti]